MARGAHVEHWLNGKKTADYELWSPDWKAKVAASKFKAWPGYGMAKRGRLSSSTTATKSPSRTSRCGC